MRISQVCVANVVDNTGRRLRLSYRNDLEDSFWCHEESPLIHHIGWAKKVGHEIDASQEYNDRCALEISSDMDCTEEMFPSYREPSRRFVAGMKLEAVDPLNLATICVATVMKVLRFGYIMIRIDAYEEEDQSDWFCYHTTSSLIFPPGFCDRHSILLKAPAEHQGVFQWKTYLQKTDSVAAPSCLFSHEDNFQHGFTIQMRLECA